MKSVVRFVFALVCLPLGHSVFSATYNGPLYMQNGFGAPGGVESPQTNGSVVRYQWRKDNLAGASGWMKVEWDSWATQFGSSTGNPIVASLNNSAAVSSAGRFQVAADSPSPSDITLNGVETSKTYVITFADTGSVFADSGVDDQLAIALHEINHVGGLVTLGSPTTTYDGTNVNLGTASSAEVAGSSEELWFNWTTNNFASSEFVQFTNIQNNTTLPLAGIALGSTIKWKAMTSSATDTGTVNGTSSGVANFDAMAIAYTPVQTFILAPGTQDIAVLGGPFSITNTENAPSSLKGTDFGSFNMNFGSSVRIFSITNTGSGALDLGGASPVSISGHADFTIVAQPSLTLLAPGARTTFTLKFDPAAEGARTGVVVITNNDPDEAPFSFAIAGTGYTNRNYFVNDAATSGDIYCTDVGDDGNSGLSANLPKPSVNAILEDYVVGPGDVIYVDTGAYTEGVNVTSNESGSFSAPIAIIGSTNRQAGGSVISVGGAPGFSVTEVSYISIENFVVVDCNAGVGIVDSIARLRNLHLFSNATGFEFAGSQVDASGVSAVSNAGYQVSLQSGAASIDQATLMGEGGVWYAAVSSLSISNSIVGADDVYLFNTPGVFPFAGDHNGFFLASGNDGFASINGVVFSTLADYHNVFGGGETSTSGDPLFANPAMGDVRLKSTTGRYVPASGTFTQDVQHSPFIDLGDRAKPFALETAPNGSRVNLGAFGASAEASRSLTSGWVRALNFNDGGTALNGTQALYWTYGNLTTSETVKVEVSRDDGASWSNVAASLPIADEEAGWDTTGLSISSDTWWRVVLVSDTNIADVNDTKFVSGGSLGPQIVVLGTNLAAIANGEAPGDLAKGTDFGAVSVSNSSVFITITITNAGQSALALGGLPPVQLSGDNDFWVNAQPGSTLLAPAGVTTFEIGFNPNIHGTRTSVVSIVNNAGAPFMFAINGQGVGNVYNGPLYLQDGFGSGGPVVYPTTNGNIRYQWRKTEQSSASGWMKMEWDSWATQIGANNGGAFTVSPSNNVLIDSRVMFQVNGDTGVSPDDITVESLETNKTYVFNVVDSGVELANSLQYEGAAFAVNEVNHAGPLVVLEAQTQITAYVGGEVRLESGSTAEQPGSNEELWFQWTTNNFTELSVVEFTVISNNTTLVLAGINPGATVKWLVMSSSDSDTGVLSGITSGLLNFDVVAIEKTGVQSFNVPGGGDSDNDGMDDDWEILYFGDLSRDGTNNLDTDVFSDLQEFISDTNPTNAADYLRLTGASFAISNKALVLQWNSSTSVVYKVYSATSQPGLWTNLVFTAPGNGAQQAQTNNIGAGTPPFGVYHLEAQRP